MLIIRLQRVGRKNDPSFRVIVTDSHRAAKTGKVVEVVGNYNARQTAGGKERNIELSGERIKHWLSEGAQTSGTVHNLLVDAKLVSGPKINVLPRKSAPAKAPTETKVEAPAEVPAPAETASEPPAEPIA
jgi:small subunit ribosomal protein S16